MDMHRIPEPEVMDNPEQVVSYVQADFRESNQFFVNWFRSQFPDFETGHIVDLGCGSADIAIRFCRALPGIKITAVDASAPMLDSARLGILRAGLSSRVRLIHGYLPNISLPEENYDAVICNDMLHHLPDPIALWQKIAVLGRPGVPIMLRDLSRPDSPQEAQAIVNALAGTESPIVQKDFYYSLLASYVPAEIEEQLVLAGLTNMQIQIVSRSHLVVWGKV